MISTQNYFLTPNNNICSTKFYTNIPKHQLYKLKFKNLFSLTYNQTNQTELFFFDQKPN